MIRLLMALSLMAFLPGTVFSVELSEDLVGKGVQVGDVHIFPVLDVTQQLDSNVALSESRPVSSPVSIVSPAISMMAGSSMNFYGISYRAEYGSFWNSLDDNYFDHFVDVFSHHEFSRRARMDVGLNYTRSHDRRGSTFTGIIARLLGFNKPDRWHQTSVAAAFEYGSEGARMKLAANTSFAVKRYDNNKLFTRTLDVNNAIIGGTLYYRVRSKFYTLFEANYGVLDYSLIGSPLDSKELTLSGGVTWEATSKTTGTIKVGWRHRTFDLSNQTNSGLSWNAALTWTPLSYSTWEFNTSFAGSEALGAAGSFVQTLRNQLNWAHQWRTGFRHELSVAIGRDKYIGTTRVDHLTDVGVNLIYPFNRWLEVSGGYAYSRRSSNQAFSSYKQQIFTIAVHIEP